MTNEEILKEVTTKYGWRDGKDQKPSYIWAEWNNPYPVDNKVMSGFQKRLTTSGEVPSDFLTYVLLIQLRQYKLGQSGE